MGLIHEVAPAGEIDAARQGLGQGQPQRQGAVGRSEVQAARRHGVFAGRHDDLAAGQRDLSPRDLRQLPGARKAILPSVFEGLQLPMDLALAVESKYFAKILRSKEAAAMIRSLFFSMGELNKGVRRPAERAADQAQEDRRARRRHDGRRHRLCLGQRRASRSCSWTATRRPPTRARRYSEKLVTEGQIAKRPRHEPADGEALLARITPTADSDGARRAATS